MSTTDGSMLMIRNLRKQFNTRYGVLIAVAGVTFRINDSEIFGLVGESGSGKSTVGSMIAGMYASNGGEILYRGQDIDKPAAKRSQQLKREIQMVFQDPGGSLNPRQTIRQILSFPLRVHTQSKRGKDLENGIKMAIAKVGLPLSYLEKYPQAIGGGEKQLVCIARALAPNPSFIVLDEPTSALDVSIQAKISNTLLELQREFGLSYLFITHNLCLVRNLVHRTAIMYLGQLYEAAPTGEFFSDPLHPYTQMLLSSIPVISDAEEQYKPKEVKSVGEIPNPIHRPSGCGFHTRCLFCMNICKVEEPEMVEIKPNHFVCCHLHTMVP
jgi:oligopeptide/dipeptide ABC transporter ATP-binding protein